MTNGCVPWPGPVLAPGASNVMAVGSSLKAVGAKILSSKIELMATANSHAEVKMFVRLVVVFVLPFVDFFMTTLEDWL